MPIEWAGFAFPKGTARVLEREVKHREEATAEKKAMTQVRKRDGKGCRVPTCQESGAHTHHIRYRSLGGLSTTQNMLRLCLKHHQYVHAGILSITGDADKEPTFEGRI